MLKSELENITDKQKELLEQVEEFNGEKRKLLEEFYVVDDTKYQRFINLTEKYREIFSNGDKDFISNKNKVSEIYTSICGKIFSKSIELKKNYSEGENTYSYWSVSKKDVIFFSRKGLAFKPHYRYRLRALDDFPLTVKILSKDKELRDLPLTPRKLDLWQNLYDIVIQYKPINIDFTKKTDLKNPIKILGVDEKMEYSSDNIKFGNIKYLDIRKVEFCLGSSYRRSIRFYDSKGSELSQFSLDLTGDNDSFIGLKYFLSQLPEEFFSEIEKYITDMSEGVRINMGIYEQIKEKFGFLLLSDHL